jgi:putative oxidoreductase
MLQTRLLVLRQLVRSLLDETMPGHLYSFIRISVGIIYFWFGLLKFPFIPGGSSAESLISAWSSFISPHLFTFILAFFETTAGLLLLLNLLTRLVALILIGHVCGTFLTVIVGTGQLFNLEYGFYSLTLSGQYVVKNMLLLSCCVALVWTTPRRYKRLPLRTTVRMRCHSQDYTCITKDISLGGASLLLDMPEQSRFVVHDRVHLSLDLPFASAPIELDAILAHQTRIPLWPFSVALVGCEFCDKTIAAEFLAPYLSNDTEVVMNMLAPVLGRVCKPWPVGYTHRYETQRTDEHAMEAVPTAASTSKT